MALTNSERNKRWRTNNPEKWNEQQRRYQGKNREKMAILRLKSLIRKYPVAAQDIIEAEKLKVSKKDKD